MDPFTLIGVAANLARVIIHLTYTYKLQATHVGILVDRITSLEKPLETLERAGKAGAHKISEAALRKLIGTLEEVQKLILEHQRSDNKSKAKRFLFGDANMDDLKLIRERLDSSLLDLQLAITVEEVGNSEKRVHQTARATVDILMTAVQQRSTEAILKCVQCSEEFRQSENPMGSCKYHTAFPHVRNWKHEVACCGKQFAEEEDSFAIGCEGCTRGVHCDFQHTQYPYSAYFVWMRNQVRTNIKEVWLRVTDWDFEDSVEKYAEFGISKDNLLFVTLGKGFHTLFLQYFDPANMPQVSSAIGDMMTIAMRGTDMSPGELEKSDNPNKWIVDALWTLDENSEIHGIRLSANSMSSKFPVIKELSLSFNPLTKGDIRVLSFSGAPDKGCFTDALPECSSSFVNFPDSVSQPPPLEPNYETVNSGNLQVRLKKCEPCAANPERTGHGHDTFVLQFYVMNLSQGATLGSSTEERMVVLNMLKEGKMTVDEAIRLIGTLDTSPHQHGPLTFIDARARFYYNDRWVNASHMDIKMKKEDKMIEALPFEVAPSTPLPPVPTSNAPPSAQPSRAPPSAQGNGFTRTTPTPPPRHLSSSNGIAKPPATTPASTPSSTPSPAPAPSPKLAPASTPAPAPTPAPTPAPASPTSPAPDAAAVSALLTSLSPPPLNQTVSSPPPPAKVDDRVVVRCSNCAFGIKKDQCIKCKSSVPPVPTPAPGLLCITCKLQHKGKCWTCPTQVGTKGIPTIVCSKCNFGGAKDKCIKCGKPT